MALTKTKLDSSLEQQEAHDPMEQQLPSSVKFLDLQLSKKQESVAQPENKMNNSHTSNNEFKNTKTAQLITEDAKASDPKGPKKKNRVIQKHFMRASTKMHIKPIPVQSDDYNSAEMVNKRANNPNSID